MAGLFVVGISGQAQAATYLDTYIGGANPPGYVGADVVANPGDLRFNIASMDVTRSGNSLNVVVNTNYSGANVGAYSTNLGDLFLGTIPNYGVTNNVTDTFVGHPARFSDVFHFDTNPVNNNATPSQGGTATLYKLNGTGSDVVLSHAIGGFRHYQAVSTTSTVKEGLSGTWSTSAGNVTFNIANFFAPGGLGVGKGIYSTGLTLAWAMTCANDVIFEKVALGSEVPVPDVPLPAGLVLFLSGLVGLGSLGRMKEKNPVRLHDLPEAGKI